MAGAFLAVGESGWRVTITGGFNSGALPSGYMDRLHRFEEAIKAIGDVPVDDVRSEVDMGRANAKGIIAAEANAVENPDEYVFWPTTGTVTSKEIASAWVIGESTFKQKVYEGIYPKQLETESMRNLWDVQAVTKALVYSSVQRRRAPIHK